LTVSSSIPPFSVSVIIPVYNGARTLPSVLLALSRARPAPDEIVVVDDGSTDNSGALAAKAGCHTIIRLDRNVGAAVAKNRGAAAARGDILFFTDADVLVPGDIIARLLQAFQEARCDAVIGLLDTHIPETNLASQFKNLWMNFTYARFTGHDRIGLFYTSAAAIRREAFSQLGGFDENYRGASTAEDTEFGQRAWAKGVRIRLDPKLRVVHLKGYTLSGVLREDFRRARALMLMRLRKWRQPFFTSVPFSFQLGVPLIYSAVLLFVVAILIREPIPWSATGIALAAFFLLNTRLLAFLERARGMAFAACASLFLPLDSLVVGLGMIAAAYDLARGKRY
jgi:glycosyltransferase involved in cell wall biosynthesis